MRLKKNPDGLKKKTPNTKHSGPQHTAAIYSLVRIWQNTVKQSVELECRCMNAMFNDLVALIDVNEDGQ